MVFPFASAQKKAADLFLFLEIFEQEGGIQSHGQALLQSYLEVSDRPANVFLLRDRLCSIPFSSESLYRDAAGQGRSLS